MTQFQLETTEKLTIQSYSSGEINIALSGNQSEQQSPNSTQCMTTSFILTPHTVVQNWLYDKVADLNAESFEPLIEHQPELVVLGTGEKLSFPDHQALMSFHKAGIGVEVMNTASACRTFNVLVSENRFVVAGLLMI